ncbi:MAG: PD40 domain-containing protein [Sediminibacterium sp.]|nr:PD40 domain-containing protein [Sediminibacterium sp.]MBX9781136.1 PDZ domain-containing protein [Chitinophagaceae bacterium]
MRSSCRKPLQSYLSLSLILILVTAGSIQAQGTRLLRQPDISATQIVFAYGADLWISDLDGSNLIRLTSTPAVEMEPHFSPDGKWIAFTSNRSGSNAVYVVSSKGGEATRLTWHPANSIARGWSVDGKNILYSCERETAPTPHMRLWSVPATGGPSKLLSKQWGNDGSYSPDGTKLVIDKVDRWDVEWRAYRGGQNTPLIILDLATQAETLLPNNRTIDIQPVWIGDNIYFLSDRDGGVANIWSYNTNTKAVTAITSFKGADVKWLSGNGKKLVYEREGFLHTIDLTGNNNKQLAINVVGDFPWAAPRWENIGRRIESASISPTGKRAILEARGEIFTAPVENGDVRNITQSSTAADRAPIWSPKGNEIAWFSDAGGKGYALMIAPQDGMGKPRSIAIGISKMIWEPTWSPDGKYIAFVDDDLRIQVIELSTGNLTTADIGGINIERGRMGLTWSPDAQWLAYSKTGSNMLRGVKAWNVKTKAILNLTNPFADAFSPAWDRDNKHLYFLASTELGLASGWANTSSQNARAEYEAYVINLRKTDQSPFKPTSDEEEVKPEEKPKTEEAPKPVETKPADTKAADKTKVDVKPKTAEAKPKDDKEVIIDIADIDRRTIPLPLPKRNYVEIIAGPAGSMFINERIPNRPSSLQKFTLESKEAKEFTTGATGISISADGKKILLNQQGSWKIASTNGPSAADAKNVKTDLRVYLNREEEWLQIFNEAWRYERDFFYDPNMHGRDWDEVYRRYAPLVPYVKHRDDLTYILDQVNGELSVGHSFVGGGDYPSVDVPSVGLLGADLIADKGRWKIARIYNTESWNAGLSSPLDRPGIKVAVGDYIVGINGKELTANDDPYKMLDGTADIQTTIHVNKNPVFEGHTTEIVKPLRSDNALRQRAWVEDNRRYVDSLSGGKLAYIWIPNTGGPGFVSFNRYYFAQQDKLGAVVDERYNGGGLLDDYMVDLMNRSLRAALTNEVPNGKPMALPAGILGPKVLLINELAGSGGDFFPWAFRQQKVGPLIGARTWGGLVKSSVHYTMVDGGYLTAPDNAVFDPINRKWVAENEGVPPDIEVRQDAQSLQAGKDPQLERAVKELLQTLSKSPAIDIKVPAYPTPAKTKN